MKVKNKLLTLLILSTGAAASTAVINQYIKFSAVSKNLLINPEAHCYKWRLGNIHYTKYGKVRLYDRDKNGNDIIVEDPDVLYVISRYLRLSKEGRDLAHARLLRLIWES